MPVVGDCGVVERVARKGARIQVGRAGRHARHRHRHRALHHLLGSHLKLSSVRTCSQVLAASLISPINMDASRSAMLAAMSGTAVGTARCTISVVFNTYGSGLRCGRDITA